HPPLEPADHLLCREEARRAIDQLGHRELFSDRADGGEEGRDLVVRERRPEVRPLHAVALGAVAPFVAEHLVMDRERDADRPAGVARRGLDPEPAERALAEEPTVADAVERDAAGEAE